MLVRLLRKLTGADLTEAMAMATRLVQERLRNRGQIDLNELVAMCDLPEQHRDNAKLLLRRVAGVIGVSPECFRNGDRLGDLLRIEVGELDERSLAVLSSYGLQDRVEVFGYDMLQLLEKLCDDTVWARLHSVLPRRPTNEDEWLDAILAMDLCAFVRVFAPDLKA